MFLLSFPFDIHDFLSPITGAAGNFLAPIAKLSENGFKTVIEIDTVSDAMLLGCARTTTT